MADKKTTTAKAPERFTLTGADRHTYTIPKVGKVTVQKDESIKAVHYDLLSDGEKQLFTAAK